LDEYSGPRYEIESRRITVVHLVIFVILENNLYFVRHWHC
jgi:hypothetical protein